MQSIRKKRSFTDENLRQIRRTNIPGEGSAITMPRENEPVIRMGMLSENDSLNRRGDRFGTQFHRKIFGVQLVQFDNAAVMSVALRESVDQVASKL
jgi:hypothetical protein